MSITELLANIGRPVAYYPSIAKAVGSVKTGIFICQMIYWHSRGTNEDGWFYKSVEDLTEETGLSYKEQRSARKVLSEMGVLEESYSRTEHRLYYRLNLAVLDGIWEEFSSEKTKGICSLGKCPKGSNHLPKGHMAPSQKAGGICPKGSSYIRNREYTESTTESTQRDKSAREATPPSESTPPEPFPEKPIPSESVCKHSTESPLALEIRRICKKGIMLSQRDQRELQEVLTGLSMENATPEQAQEFGRKLRFHWIGRDGRTGAPRAPRIIQVLEHWHDVLSLDESAEVLSQISTPTGGNREHRSITNLRNALIYN